MIRRRSVVASLRNLERQTGGVRHVAHDFTENSSAGISLRVAVDFIESRCRKLLNANSGDDHGPLACGLLDRE
jgi:hypothetical protein